MSHESPAIVVATDLSIEMRADGRMFAGRLKELGLTAYGRTAEEAREAVLKGFNEWVNLHRSFGEGVLERRLDQLGAHYEPLESYCGQLPVIDTRKLLQATDVASPPSYFYSSMHGPAGFAA